MIIAHYAHRLPADYDVSILRKRARDRGPFWNDFQQLYFKAFLLRERGHFGARANCYSTLYLWQHDEALRDFLAAGHYQTVTDSFGRAEIHTPLVLDARKGRAESAQFASMKEFDIPLDGELTDALAAEIRRNSEAAAEPGAVAAVIAVDTKNWKFTRILLSVDEPTTKECGIVHQVLHLAQPLLKTLKPGVRDQGS
ncbi:DUF4865 family protein [Hyphomicrobium sp. 802]|uniref:DUF4865 family protein n=1 Tax=Hyphomicrobium sp. 802 TaxID=1112272 RepID=UPI00045E7860|nr:DUF4865 family protein [Hyphomicrobium sp. 802]